MINIFLISIITLFCINTNYICDNENPLNLSIRNNINGYFIKIKEISEVKPGSFINIEWKNKSLMLPLSLRRGFLSFSDLKWNWRYEYNKSGEINQKEATLYEILASGKNIEHNCMSSP